MAYQKPEGGGGFINPSDGEHDAVVIGWEDRGVSISSYNGKEREVHQAVIKYEILDETLPDDEEFGDNAGKRLVLWDWVNIAWGKRAKLTERRAAILGTTIDDIVTQDTFDETHLLGQRVVIYVKENENGNPKVLDVRRHKDQNYGQLENDLEAKAFEEDPAGVTGRAPQAQTSAPSSPPPPPPTTKSQPTPPKADSRSPEERLNDARTYFVELMELCNKNDLCDNAQAQIDWAGTTSDLNALTDQIKAFETILKDGDIPLPEKTSHPLSSGDDLLPF